MNKKITFLGIETSCDETAAAVIRENEKSTADILSNVVSSQIEEHKEFGGVVPELAARAHLENIEFIIDKALKDSKISLKEIDGVAATAGPGLIVCLTVGLNIGKSIAAFSNKPFVGVNHLEGHALSPGLENKIEFPYLLLLISGGHTQYLIVKDINSLNPLIKGGGQEYGLRSGTENLMNIEGFRASVEDKLLELNSGKCEEIKSKRDYLEEMILNLIFLFR